MSVAGSESGMRSSTSPPATARPARWRSQSPMSRRGVPGCVSEMARLSRGSWLGSPQTTRCGVVCSSAAARPLDQVLFTHTPIPTSKPESSRGTWSPSTSTMLSCFRMAPGRLGHPRLAGHAKGIVGRRAIAGKSASQSGRRYRLRHDIVSTLESTESRPNGQGQPSRNVIDQGAGLLQSSVQNSATIQRPFSSMPGKVAPASLVNVARFTLVPAIEVVLYQAS